MLNLNTIDVRNQIPRHTSFEGTPLYEALKLGLAELIGSRDVVLMTPHEKVIGYLCKKVENSRHHDHRRVM